MKKRIVIASISIAIISIAAIFLFQTYATDPIAPNDSYAITLTGDTTVSMPANSGKTIIYQIKNTNNGTVKYGVGYTSTTGNSVVYIWADSTDPATGTIEKNNYKYIKLRIENRTATPDTVELSTILGYENGGDLVLPSGIIQTTQTYTPPPKAAEYITDLYLNNKDASTVTNNGIQYQYASSKGLMNDRLGGTTESLDGGDIRYYGANPNNYVWLGDTYTSSYTFTDVNGTSVTRAAGDKKLWRIIGVFNGKLKLVQLDPISTTNLSWDTSASGVNNGSGINEWAQADIMKLLNPTFDNNQDLNSSGTTITVNNSLYWNKGTGTVYSGQNNATTPNVSFANTGLSPREKSMIEEETWYLGGYDGTASYVNVQYAAERQSTTLGKKCSLSNDCNDDIVRTAIWNGKVGLIYPSDYGYATDFTKCNQKLYDYYKNTNSSACSKKNWIKIINSTSNFSTYYQWTISPRAYSYSAYRIFAITYDGALAYSDAYGYGINYVNPVIYLKSSVLIDTDNKDGSIEHPYELLLG